MLNTPTPTLTVISIGIFYSLYNNFIKQKVLPVEKYSKACEKEFDNYIISVQNNNFIIERNILLRNYLIHNVHRVQFF